LLAEKVGLIAGGGRIPFLIAERAAGRGHGVFIAALRGQAAQELRSLAEEFAWVGLAQVGRMIDFFKRHGVRQAIFAGTVAKSEMYSPLKFLRNPPDLRSVKLWYQKLRDRKDVTILSVVADEFGREGIEIVSGLKYLSDCLTPAGTLTKRAPDRREMEDIEFGWRIARAIAEQDVGQSVVVKDRAVVAVEAMEGTDETIRRGGKLAQGGAVLVKFSRPRQDPRFDIPAAGPDTVEACAAAGVSVISLIALADRENIAIHGFAPASGVDAMEAGDEARRSGSGRGDALR
jgi:hypothetical protein